jgi:DNA invertase Pin-like site-specific DNA recombinase
MSSSLKISQDHLKRKAIVYVRQSSQHQVQNNLESQRRQYDLKRRAIILGWSEDHCSVIDDDLGISAARSDNRPGYQRLISMIALKEVGIIFGIEVSRLARNCLDWYQLLEGTSSLFPTFQVNACLR